MTNTTWITARSRRHIIHFTKTSMTAVDVKIDVKNEGNIQARNKHIIIVDIILVENFGCVLAAKRFIIKVMKKLRYGYFRPRLVWNKGLQHCFWERGLRHHFPG